MAQLNDTVVNGGLTVNGSENINGTLKVSKTSSLGDISSSGNIKISHATSADMSFASSNPSIEFSESGQQPVKLVYTDYDNYRPPAGLKVIGNAANCWLEVDGAFYAKSIGSSDSAAGLKVQKICGQSGKWTLEDSNGNFSTNGTIRGSTVYGAVWNDLADLIVVPDDTKLEYGKCYCTNGSEYTQSTKYCQNNIIGIHSDTAGFSMGLVESKVQLHIGVAGFVLAFTDKTYPSGTPLTCTKNGYLTKMKLINRLLHPERLVGIYWKDELNKDWNGIEVNGRNWIKIK